MVSAFYIFPYIRTKDTHTCELHLQLVLPQFQSSNRCRTWQKIGLWDMPTIKHTNKACKPAATATTFACLMPLAPCSLPLFLLFFAWVFWLLGCVFFFCSSVGGKPFVYFIIFGYLAAPCAVPPPQPLPRITLQLLFFCIWSVAKTLKTKFI